MPITDFAGRWALDDGSGSSAQDASGNGHHGTLAGATLPSWIAGRVGSGALHFASGATVSIAAITGFAATNVAHTLACWMRVASWIDADVIICRDNAGSGANTLQIRDGLPAVARWGGAINVQAAVAPSVDAWHHYAWTTAGDGGAGTLYIDGVAVATDTVFLQTAPIEQIYLSTWNGTDSAFTGDLDEVRFYNRQLTAAEVAELVQFGAARLSVHACFLF